MISEFMLHSLEKPWVDKILSRMGNQMQHLAEFQHKINPLSEEKKMLLDARKARVLASISMDKEPDRVPVVTNGVNFFPALYSGVSCKDFMFDYKKNRFATQSLLRDFDFDMYFANSMVAIGNLASIAQFNLISMPGRDLPDNVCYQFNEVDRLKDDEYEQFCSEGIDFLVKTLSPRIAPGIFKRNRSDQLKMETLFVLEATKYFSHQMKCQADMYDFGHWSLYGAPGYSTYDIFGFAFRTLHSLSRDLMKKKKRVKIIEILDRMAPWLLSIIRKFSMISGQPGIWFCVERAFSLSPRQFEQYYWPTLKKMILSQVKNGQMPFLTFEGDCTHLVKFLLELPKSVSRKCVFNCDNSDIIEVNKILDGHMCITGNVPLSTLCVGTPHDVEKYCDKIFPELMPGGGFMLSGALGIPDEAKPENIHAMINYAKKHGKY